MDKETLSHYGWVVVLVLILSVMLALATPFGQFISKGFESTYQSFIYTNGKALGAIPIPGSTKPIVPPEENGGENTEVLWVGDWEWSLNDDGKTITLHKYIGEDALTIEELVVPNKYQPDSNSPVYTVTKAESADNVYVDGGIPAPAYNLLGSTSNTTLKSLVISDGVEVGRGIGSGMKSLTNIEFGKGITSIGHRAFDQCESLAIDVVIPDTVTYIGVQAFSRGKIQSVEIGSGVVEIGNNAFRLCSELKSVDFSRATSLKTIKNYAFADNVAACPVDLRNTVIEELGPGAFAGYAFNKPSKWTAVYLPSTLKYLCSRAFENGQFIKNEIVLPDGLEFIGDAVFSQCSKLTNTTLKIPASLKKIGGVYPTDAMRPADQPQSQYPFYNFAYSYFKGFDVDENNQYFTDVDGILYSKDMTRLICFPPAKEHGSVFEIPNTVNSIDDCALALVSKNSVHNKIDTIILPNDFIIAEMTNDIMGTRYNTLSGILYRSSIRYIQVRDDNPRYKSIDGNIYSKDGTILYAINVTSETVNIPEGVVQEFHGALTMSNDVDRTFILPSTLTSVSTQFNASLADNGEQGANIVNIVIPESNPKYKAVQMTDRAYPYWQIVEK